MMAIGNCYSELGMPRWSVHYFQKALRLDPGNADLIYNLGNAFFDMGDYKSAIRVYKRACKRADGALLRACATNIELAQKELSSLVGNGKRGIR